MCVISRTHTWQKPPCALPRPALLTGIRSVVALMRAVLYRSQERVLTERFRQVVLMLDGRLAQTFLFRSAPETESYTVELALLLLG